ncbi:MAG: FHA domain-containing protein [Chromatiales bacterium]|nr:FHA domain-containing protein [Chromatiales bacterium]
MEPKSSECAILFADICGSTELYDQVGNLAAMERVSTAIQAISAIAVEAGGRVIKTIGDEVMCTFPQAGSAIECASAMQRAMDDGASAVGPETLPMLPIKIGIHYGPVLEENADVFGDTVNVASRMVGLAKPGEIITTLASVEGSPEETQAKTRFIDRAYVKGKKDRIDVYEVIWREGDDLTAVFSTDSPTGPLGAKLLLSLGGKSVVLDAKNASASLGRSFDNDIVVNDSTVSRRHARVECRRDKFFLVDESRNGTYVQPEAGRSITLRRDEMLLSGAGIITLGRPVDEAGADTQIRYVGERA